MIRTIVRSIRGAISGLYDNIFNPMTKPVDRYERSAKLTVTVESHDRRLAVTRLAFGELALIVPYADIPVGKEIRIHIEAFDVSLALTPPQDISTSNIIPGKVISIDEREDGQMDIAVDIGVEIWACITRSALSRLDLEPGKEIYALVKAVAMDRQGLGRWNVNHNLFPYNIVGDPIGEERRAREKWIKGAIKIISERRVVSFKEAREKSARWLMELHDMFDCIRGDEDMGNYFKPFYNDEEVIAYLREVNEADDNVDGIYDISIPLDDQHPGGLTKDEWLEKYGPGKPNGK